MCIEFTQDPHKLGFQNGKPFFVYKVVRYERSFIEGFTSQFIPYGRDRAPGFKHSGKLLKYYIRERTVSPSGPGIFFWYSRGKAMQERSSRGSHFYSRLAVLKCEIPAGATVRLGDEGGATSELFVVGRVA